MMNTSISDSASEIICSEQITDDFANVRYKHKKYKKIN